MEFDLQNFFSIFFEFFSSWKIAKIHNKKLLFPPSSSKNITAELKNNNNDNNISENNSILEAIGIKVRLEIGFCLPFLYFLHSKCMKKIEIDDFLLQTLFSFDVPFSNLVFLSEAKQSRRIPTRKIQIIQIIQNCNFC